MSAKKRKAERDDLIGMAEAIQILGTSRPTFYRWLRSGKVKGMKAGRQWRFYRRDIEAFLKGEAPRIDLPADIMPLVEQLETRIRESSYPLPDRVKSESDVDYTVRLMIALGVALRATDIHVTSHMPTGQRKPVCALRYRIDGALHVVTEIDYRLLTAIVLAWKRRAQCDIHETRLPQDGRILTEVAHPGDRKPESVDLRMCAIPTVLGESLTIRLLRADTVCMDLDQLPYSPGDAERIRSALDRPWGLIVCSGPTGSGKTTTLYACLQHVTRVDRKIVTVEDPVEYALPWATQMRVDRNVGMTFAPAIRSILRSDPDVIMVGEIRDRDSLEACLQASLTGHLVLTTLHTDSAARALVRMTEIGAGPFVVADATSLIIAQKLVRRLCPACARPTELSADDAAMLDHLATAGGADLGSMPGEFKEPVGCEECRQTGYRGRTVISETLRLSPAIGRAIREDVEAEALQDIAVREGMRTIAADAIRLVADGQTSLQELRVAVETH